MIVSPASTEVAKPAVPLEQELDAHLRAKYGTAKVKRLKVNVVRYADDCVPRRRDEGKLLERLAA